jgi:hypothetical protein
MTIDNRTPAEIAYDSLKSGAAYSKSDYTPLSPAWEAVLDITDDPDRCCPNGTPERDCPACTAKYEAERQQVHARATVATTARERVDILLEGSEVPNGDQIFDLLLEDEVAHYAWVRCIDWVLWRQAHGKPVKVLGEPDCTSPAIDARYSQARDKSKDIANYRAAATTTDVHLLSAGEMIEKWERTPEEEAKIKEDADLMIAILELIDGGE